jgi:hypothetical protein
MSRSEGEGSHSSGCSLRNQALLNGFVVVEIKPVSVSVSVKKAMCYLAVMPSDGQLC